MRRVVLIALLIASPALADDDACFELGGQGIAPCAAPKGKIAFESNLFDWQREGHGGDREDTTALAQSIARIGLGSLTEARVSWTPLILDRPRGGPTMRGIDDLTLGTKHQFGKDSPLGFAVEVTLPTASNGVGQGTWSVQATAPVQIEVAKGVNFDLTGQVDAAADQDRHGRHFAASLVAGADVNLSEQLTVTTDVKLLRDNDPTGHTTQETASLALSHKLGSKGQFTVGGVAGLDHDAPVAEAYVGIGVLF
jgi:hypothetical protein